MSIVPQLNTKEFSLFLFFSSLICQCFGLLCHCILGPEWQSTPFDTIRPVIPAVISICLFGIVDARRCDTGEWNLHFEKSSKMVKIEENFCLCTFSKSISVNPQFFQFWYSWSYTTHKSLGSLKQGLQARRDTL